MIIMLTGYKRSGKDTVGSIMKKYLKKQGYKVKIIKFADYLYYVLSEILGASKEELEKIKDKEIKNTDLTPRDLMKAIALYKRQNDDLFFIKYTLAKIHTLRDYFVGYKGYDCSNNLVFIITDTRYIKEYETIKKEFNLTFLIKVIRKNIEPDDVEKEIDLLMPYDIIENNGAIEQLEKNTINVLNKILKELK